MSKMPLAQWDLIIFSPCCPSKVLNVSSGGAYKSLEKTWVECRQEVIDDCLVLGTEELILFLVCR